MKLIGVYGASGFGREVMPLIRDHAGESENVVFIDDALDGQQVNDRAVVSWEDFVSRMAVDKAVCLAVADSRLRETLFHRCMNQKVDVISVRSSNAVVMDDVGVGQGAILCPFVTLTSNIEIGKCFQANIYSYVAHDCVIGDFVTFAPRVCCNGNVIIEDHAYIGTGVVIKQGQRDSPLRIGEGAVVGMGAVVTRDVPAGVTVVGNPARDIRKGR